MAADLRDVVVLVTGASGSIGTSLRRHLVEAGATVVGIDLVPSDGVLQCDITDEGQVRSVIERAIAEHGQLDVLVNNAGITALGSIDDHSLATHRQVLEVNHLGALACTLAALPHLRASRGQVITLGSVAGFSPVVGRPAYVAAKHAVTGLMEALRPELAADGVAVTMVHPTFVTSHLGAAGAISERTSTGDEVSPDDVATAVVDAIGDRRARVLVGRTARQAWHVHRLAPGLYAQLMARRLQSSRRPPRTSGASAAPTSTTTDAHQENR